MDTTLKSTSIRCDLHPPLSAIMFCDACKSFLCRICAEVRVGGRVCATCKKPCREPSTEEFSQLIAQRQKAREDAVLAKAAEGRIKEQLEKGKADRDTRLKADFAARKAVLAQQQLATANGAPLASFASQQVPQQFNAPAMLMANSSSPSPMAAGGGTMYQPGAIKPRYARDELAALGDRAHLNVIGRAKWYMIIIGLLTTFIYAVALYFVASIESTFDSADMNTFRDEMREIRKVNRLKMTPAQLKEHEERLAREREAADAAAAVARAVVGKLKLFLAAYMMVGVTMIVLFFLSDSYPRGATMAAFLIYLIINIIDVFSIRTGGFYGIFFRVGAMTALFNGMIAGQELHKRRMADQEALRDGF